MKTNEEETKQCRIFENTSSKNYLRKEQYALYKNPRCIMPPANNCSDIGKTFTRRLLIIAVTINRMFYTNFFLYLLNDKKYKNIIKISYQDKTDGYT